MRSYPNSASASGGVSTGRETFQVAGYDGLDSEFGAGGAVLQAILKVGEAEREGCFNDGAADGNNLHQACQLREGSYTLSGRISFA